MGQTKHSIGIASGFGAASFPRLRMRRARRAPWVRRLVAEARLASEDLILPLFLRSDESVPAAIARLPGVRRLTPSEAVDVAGRARDLGIPAVAPFPWVDEDDKDPTCREAVNPENLMCRAVRALKEAHPDLGVICDVALDPYNSSGHDGLVGRDGSVQNDATNALLARQGLVLAEAGADILAPSDMMDGRIGVLRAALEDSGRHDTLILSYAVKYASVFYGPFREAVGSERALVGDKKTYQMNPANTDEALREVALDLAEGADFVLVKPGTPYLDLVSRIKRHFGAPTFVYQVSGEYAMLRFAAEGGAFAYEDALLESLLCARRAGADAILTYGALEAAALLRAGRGNTG